MMECWVSARSRRRLARGSRDRKQGQQEISEKQAQEAGMR